MSEFFRYDFEQYRRSTAPRACMTNPSQLYDLAVYETYRAVELGVHYGDKLVGAVAPVYDSGEGVLFHEPTLKLVSSGNFKPKREDEQDASYTRVCAEQNLIDNGLTEGDLLLGALFIRFKQRPYELEGNPFDGAFLCGPCRDRALRVIGPNIVVVSFVGENDMPDQIMTIGQMNDVQRSGENIEPLAKPKEIRDYVVEEVLSKTDYQFRLRHKPRVPSRIYKRPSSLPFAE